MKIITNLLDKYGVDALINKTSVLDTKLKQIDLLSLNLLATREVYNTLEIEETDTYENAGSFSNFSQIASNIAIQLHTSNIYNIVLRSRSNAYFSPTTFAYSGSTEDNTDIGSYNNKLYVQLKKNEGRITFLNTNDYNFNIRNRQKCFGMGRLIQSVNQKELGYLVIFIKYDFFQNLFEDSYFGSKSSFCIFAGDGSIIYSRTENNNAVNYLQSNLQNLPEEKNSVILKNENGIPSLVSYYTSSYSGWTLVNMVPVSGLLSGMLYSQSFTVLFCILFVILAVIVAAYISSDVSKPVKSLVQTMREISRGNLSLRTKVFEGYEIRELCIHFNNMIQKISLLMEENQDKQKALLKTELSMLQAQINPHFLYNTLNSVRWISIINKQEQIKNLIDDLAKLFMNSFNVDNELIKIEDELSILQSYINIMKVRYNNFKLDVDINPSLLRYKILKFVIQPFIENSIIHGFSKIDYLGHISIAFERIDTDLLIKIMDNGSGIPADKKPELLNNEHNAHFSSIGLYNVNKRIQLHYGENYGIEVCHNEPSGTIIEIKLLLLD